MNCLIKYAILINENEMRSIASFLVMVQFGFIVTTETLRALRFTKIILSEP